MQQKTKVLLNHQLEIKLSNEYGLIAQKISNYFTDYTIHVLGAPINSNKSFSHGI